jgi:hypothetical protein
LVKRTTRLELVTFGLGIGLLVNEGEKNRNVQNVEAQGVAASPGAEGPADLAEPSHLRK